MSFCLGVTASPRPLGLSLTASLLLLRRMRMMIYNESEPLNAVGVGAQVKGSIEANTVE